MLLEEAVLHLLRRSGYRTIDSPGSDPTLCPMGAGLGVRGRGSEHQIDALADFIVHQPFSNPQRLMVEAKCYSSKYRVGIEVIRNAIGVLKDTSEFWVPGPGPVAGKKRYRYQYAVFSASSFTGGAQRYAFAHDVYLFPLDRSRYFQPILAAIRRIAPSMLVPGHISGIGEGQLSEFRAYTRKVLRGELGRAQLPDFLAAQEIDMQPFIAACHSLNYALVAVLGGRFPILLSPSPVVREQLQETQFNVRILWDSESWYIQNGNGVDLFSFDLPDELFELYAHDGFLNPERALDMKEDMMSNIQAIESTDGRARLLNLVLDRSWIEAIRTRRRRNRS